MNPIKKIKTYFLNSMNSYTFYKNYYQNSINKLDALEDNQRIILSKLETIHNNNSEIDLNKINQQTKEITEIMREHYILTTDIKNQNNDILNYLRHLNFNEKNENDIELIFKQLTLIYLTLQELTLNLDKNNDKSKNNFITLNNNLKNITNYLEYYLTYQRYEKFNQILKNKEKYLISVIIPLYNIEKSFVMRAFNSISRQTLGFENLEVIFVDDKSTFKEGTYFAEELSESYPNVKLIKLNETCGTNHARNFGLKHAKGKYIMFLDQDGAYLQNSCEILYENIDQNLADIACGNYINLSIDGSEKIDWTSYNITDYLIISDNIENHMELFEVDSSIWTKIFRKQFLDENNISFYEYKYGNELLFYHETLFKANKIVNINEPIVIYEQGTNNLDKTSFSSNNNFDTLKDLMKIYKKDYELFKKYNKKCMGIPLKLNLNYFVTKRLKHSSLTLNEYFEIMNIGKELFEYFVEHNLETVPYFRKMFDYIAKNDMDNAYLEYKKNIK